MLSPYSTRPREPAVHSHSILYTAYHSGMLIYSQHAIRRVCPKRVCVYSYSECFSSTAKSMCAIRRPSISEPT